MPYGESGKPGSSTSGQSSHDRGGRQHQATAAKHERRTTHHPGGGDGGTYKPTHVKPGLGPERQTKSLLDFSPTYQVGKALYKGVKSIFQPKTDLLKNKLVFKATISKRSLLTSLVIICVIFQTCERGRIILTKGRGL